MDLEGLRDRVRQEIERDARYFGRDWVARFIGEDPGIVVVRGTVRAIARLPPGTRPPALLIAGETGTGKTHVASLFRLVGPRRALADMDWMAMGVGELQRWLFDAGGYFRTIGEGAILIERVEEFPESLQERLLNVIEAPTGMWVISTTTADLALRVREGRFSAPLYEALRASSITLPPLRERGGDVILLAEDFLAQGCVRDGREPDAERLQADAIDALLRYSWPGNVRELRDAISRARLAAAGDRISAADISI